MSNFEETSIGFKAIFQKTYNETICKTDIMAMNINSNDLSEKYVWLGNFPQMKEWVGDRDIKKFKDYGYALENQLYESTVSVSNLHLEYDKVGLYKPAIEQMASDAKMFSGRLLAQLLNKADDAATKCYDGMPFFGTHTLGTNTFTNLSNLVLNSESLIATEAFMLSIIGDSGYAMGINPTHLIVGPKSLATAIKAVNKEYLAGGQTNPTFKRYELIVMPEINDLSWYLMDLSKPVKPFVKQIAKDGLFEASNDHNFIKDHALFGCKSFMNVGYALWQLAYKSKGVAA